MIFALLVNVGTAEFSGADPPSQATQWPVRADYANPTNRYAHNIMGRIRGWSALAVEVAPCRDCKAARMIIRVTQPENRVFEDFAPRLWDITGDGLPEIVVVESDLTLGARLAVWQVAGGGGSLSLRRLAATAFIGTRFRWLAPVGAADFDGDGRIEIAYVETPHRDRVLRLVRLEGGDLSPVASLPGVTNHAIGQERAESAVRTCAGVHEIVALSGDGRDVLAINWSDDGLVARKIGRAAGHQLPSWAQEC